MRRKQISGRRTRERADSCRQPLVRVAHAQSRLTVRYRNLDSECPMNRAIRYTRRSASQSDPWGGYPSRYRRTCQTSLKSSPGLLCCRLQPEWSPGSSRQPVTLQSVRPPLRPLATERVKDPRGSTTRAGVTSCPGRARTSNLLIQSQAFCQLNYRTLCMPDRA